MINWSHYKTWKQRCHFPKINSEQSEQPCVSKQKWRKLAVNMRLKYHHVRDSRFVVHLFHFENSQLKVNKWKKLCLRLIFIQPETNKRVQKRKNILIYNYYFFCKVLYSIIIQNNFADSMYGLLENFICGICGAQAPLTQCKKFLEKYTNISTVLADLVHLFLCLSQEECLCCTKIVLQGILPGYCLGYFYWLNAIIFGEILFAECVMYRRLWHNARNSW